MVQKEGMSFGYVPRVGCVRFGCDFCLFVLFGSQEQRETRLKDTDRFVCLIERTDVDVVDDGTDE